MANNAAQDLDTAPGPPPTPRPESTISEPEERKPKTEAEAERLVKSLTTGNQSLLYAYMKEHPEKEGEVNTVIGTLAPVVQAYVRRMLDSRKTADNPSPRITSPVKSPAITSTTTTTLPLKRGPRPSSLAVDKTAPVEDQLAAYKNVFARGMGSVGNGNGVGNGSGEPLSEIDEPQTRH